jgi:hypothetical protein
MANNCWNRVEITGPKETLDIIEGRFKKYKDWKGTFTEFSRMVLGLEPEVIPEHETLNDAFNRMYTYGTKWWDFEIDGDDGWLQISGDSAWSPPLGLLTMMTKVFDVKIEGEYGESGCDFGGFYTIENGVCDDNEMTYFEYELECDRNNAIDRLIVDMNYNFIDLEYAEKHNKPYLTDEEWNEVLTETNKV